MKDKLMIKYIKKKNQKGMEILIDQYNALITSVVRYHLGKLDYEEECVSVEIHVLPRHVKRRVPQNGL